MLKLTKKLVLVSLLITMVFGFSFTVLGQDTIELEFWSGIPAENGPQEAVDTWNENNPDIQVNYNRYVNNEDGNLRVNVALQTGQDIDILMSHSVNDYEQRVESQFLKDLSDKVDDEYIDNYIGSGAQKWKQNGSYYSLPTNVNAIFVMLNENALNEKGIELPEAMTVSELRKIALELKSEEFEYSFALDAGNIHGIIQNALIEEGFVGDDGKSNLDHPNVKKGLETYYKMMHEDETMPKLSLQKATNMAPEQMFLNKEIAMYQAGAWRLRMSNNSDEYPRDFSIAFIPYPHFEGQSTPAHHIGDAMSIVENSDHPEAAWKFIQWYATEGMIALAPGGRVPAHSEGPVEEATEKIVAGAEDTYNLDSLQNTYGYENIKMLPTPPYQVLDYINQEIEKYFLGNQSIDETVERMVEFHNNYLERQ